MEVVGGLYHELCDFPRWRAIRGSGGRAAAILSGQCGVRLHCYATLGEQSAIAELSTMGVQVTSYAADSGIAFAYFHALSKPHIEPPVANIVAAPSILVEGQTVLRFGLLEGDAVIRATGRAVYDPQTAHSPAAFAANGSQAAEWALVVNGVELAKIGRSADLDVAAAAVFREQAPSVIVAKRGPAGAVVFERGAAASNISAYQSARVFKIGTGDVFSAAFALFWGERRLHPVAAADRASRAVAAYCEDPLGQLSDEPVPRAAIPLERSGPILLVGAAETIGQRYTLEEVRFRLRELGASVIAPALDGAISEARAPAALLMIADGASTEDWAIADDLVKKGITRVIFAQSNGIRVPFLEFRDEITDDFATAVYHVIWAASRDSASSQ